MLIFIYLTLPIHLLTYRKRNGVYPDWNSPKRFLSLSLINPKRSFANMYQVCVNWFIHSFTIVERDCTGHALPRVVMWHYYNFSVTLFWSEQARLVWVRIICTSTCTSTCLINCSNLTTHSVDTLRINTSSPVRNDKKVEWGRCQPCSKGITYRCWWWRRPQFIDQCLI